jgi:hypothetical protein
MTFCVMPKSVAISFCDILRALRSVVETVAVILSRTESLRTLRWRGMDSNF